MEPPPSPRTTTPQMVHTRRGGACVQAPEMGEAGGGGRGGLGWRAHTGGARRGAACSAHPIGAASRHRRPAWHPLSTHRAVTGVRSAAPRGQETVAARPGPSDASHASRRWLEQMGCAPAAWSTLLQLYLRHVHNKSISIGISKRRQLLSQFRLSSDHDNCDAQTVPAVRVVGRGLALQFAQLVVPGTGTDLEEGPARHTQQPGRLQPPRAPSMLTTPSPRTSSGGSSRGGGTHLLVLDRGKVRAGALPAPVELALACAHRPPSRHASGCVRSCGIGAAWVAERCRHGASTTAAAAHMTRCGCSRRPCRSWSHTQPPSDGCGR
eukprot:SAG25_NODE_562_length_6909_cov_2.841557_10_plen_323_part_00